MSTGPEEKYISEWWDSYQEWTRAKIDALKAFVSFDKKSLIDLGAGHGYFSKYATELGATCTAVEGRQENVKYIQKIIPSSTVILMDLEKDFPSGMYDIVMSMGLIYHLEDYISHLDKCLAICNEVFILESWVDLEKDKRGEGSKGHISLGLSDYETVPAYFNLEQYFNDHSLPYTVVMTEDINYKNKMYDWKDAVHASYRYEGGYNFHRLYVVYRDGVISKS